MGHHPNNRRKGKEKIYDQEMAKRELRVAGAEAEKKKSTRPKDVKRVD